MSLTSLGLSETSYLETSFDPNFVLHLTSSKCGLLTRNKSKRALLTLPSALLSQIQSGSILSRTNPSISTTSFWVTTPPLQTISAPKPLENLSGSSLELRMYQNPSSPMATGLSHSISPEMLISSPLPTEPRNSKFINGTFYSNSQPNRNLNIHELSPLTELSESVSPNVVTSPTLNTS